MISTTNKMISTTTKVFLFLLLLLSAKIFYYFKSKYLLYKEIRDAEREIFQGNDITGIYHSFVAVNYFDGTHYKGKNLKKAAMLYEIAAKKGEYCAMTNLASMYLNNEHPDGINLQKALTLLKEAESKGDKLATENLEKYFIKCTQQD